MIRGWTIAAALLVLAACEPASTDQGAQAPAKADAKANPAEPAATDDAKATPVEPTAAPAGPTAAPVEPTQPGLAKGGKTYFTDVPLVDQRGQTHRLYSDLIQGKIVVMNFFFTSCEGACPKLNLEMSKIQKHLGDRVGKDVRLMSVSVDPTRDTPAALAEYSKAFSPSDGWYFLTGKPEDVEVALRKLGQYVEEPSAHSSIFIVGNERTGLWKKAFGLADSDELLRVVDSVVGDIATGESAADGAPAAADDSTIKEG